MIPVSGAPVEDTGPLTLSDRVVPDDLTGLSMRFTEAIETLPPGSWVVFERITVLLLYADENRVVRFLDHVAGTVRDCEMRGLFCVDRDAIDDQTYATLRRRVDTETDLR